MEKTLSEVKHVKLGDMKFNNDLNSKESKDKKNKKEEIKIKNLNLEKVNSDIKIIESNKNLNKSKSIINENEKIPVQLLKKTQKLLEIIQTQKDKILE